VHVQVARAAHDATRLGRGTSSPPQFGQTPFVSSAHDAQNVHSDEQMSASPSGPSGTSQRSHTVRISSAISSSSAPGRC
jgi:hypothetical protein